MSGRRSRKRSRSRAAPPTRDAFGRWARYGSIRDVPAVRAEEAAESDGSSAGACRPRGRVRHLRGRPPGGPRALREPRDRRRLAPWVVMTLAGVSSPVRWWPCSTHCRPSSLATAGPPLRARPNCGGHRCGTRAGGGVAAPTRGSYRVRGSTRARPARQSSWRRRAVMHRCGGLDDRVVGEFGRQSSSCSWSSSSRGGSPGAARRPPEYVNAMTYGGGR